MSDYIRLQNSFTAGYVDPTLHGLTNSELYAQGLKECDNFIPSSLGYIYRRPGTAYTGWSWTDNSRTTARLCAIRTVDGPMLVIFREGQVEFRAEWSRLFYTLTDGEELVSGDSFSDTTEVSIPWTGKELQEMDIYEFQGSLYIVHPNHRPHLIKDAGIILMSFTISDQGAAPYSVTVSGATATAISSVKVRTGFTCVPVDFEDAKFNAEREYPSCQTFKGGRWYLGGTLHNPSSIYVSKAMDARGRYRFQDFRLGEYYLLVVRSSYTKTTVYETSESEGTIESVDYKSVSEEEIRDRATLRGVDDILDYEVPESVDEDTTVGYTQEMDEYGDENQTEDPDQTKVKVTTTTSTTYSLKSDIEPDDGIELTESDMYGSPLQWLLTQQRVIAGTLRSIWMDSGEAATPSTFDMSQTLASTTSPVHPVMAGSMIIYVPADRRSVRGFYYDDNSGGYRILDISSGARTLFEDNVMQLALCEGVETVLWVLLTNGTLLSCTLGASYGWARHTLGGGGLVSSIVAYHSDEGDASLYLTVSRSNGSSWRTTIERLDLQDLVQTKVFRLLDCEMDASDITDDGTIDLEDLDDLYGGFSGDMSWLLHDGWSYPIPEDGGYAPGIVSSGDSSPTPEVKVGYSYTSRMTTLWQELPTNSSQTSLGMKRRAYSMLLQVYRSGNPYGGYWTPQRERLEQLQRLAKGNATQEQTPSLYTGLVRIPVPSNTDEMVHAVVQADEPLPMTILAIETKYNVQEA